MSLLGLYSVALLKARTFLIAFKIPLIWEKESETGLSGIKKRSKIDSYQIKIKGFPKGDKDSMIQIKDRLRKLTQYLPTLIYPMQVSVERYKMYRGNEKFADIANLNTDSWEEFRFGQIWGGHREYYWFDTTITIPQEFDGQCVVYGLTTGRESGWDATNPQFTVYVNGKLRQGFDVNHHDIVLSECAAAGEQYRIVLSAFTGDQNFSLALDSQIRVLDRRTEKYFYDISVPFNLAELKEDDDRDCIRILTALNESLNLVDFRKPWSESYYASLETAQRYLDENFYKKECGHSEQTVYCVGHTHIDVAWKWTLAVTEDKAVRSFSTVLELMRRYPEYIFMSSQAQLYQYVKKNAPEVYEEIKERVREGRWEVDGGMWVEADCNLSSGEALVRQFLYGQRFFEEEFGVKNCMLWLPDVFGYSAALPQIMQKSGLPYFMTTKINWNEFNKMPYDTFLWEGIDGSRVLTHFIPTRDFNEKGKPGKTNFFTTYNGLINPSQVLGGWDRYSQKYLNDEVLNSFGYGDGGGGPTADMLENHRRLEKGLPGCPQTRMSTAGDFFRLLEKNVRDHKYLPSWVGELYLEYHRGTYTSMARNKKWNRKSEFAYENLETYGLMNYLWNEGSYPEEMLKEGWEVILRNQFHDILPGSSIKEVYDDSKVEYEAILSENAAYTADTLEQIVRGISVGEGNLVVFWPNSTEAAGAVTFEDDGSCGEPVSVGAADSSSRDVYPVQRIADGTYIFCPQKLPSKGYQTFAVNYQEMETDGIRTEEKFCRMDNICSGSMIITPSIMENDYIRLELNEKGRFSRMYDRQHAREILKPGAVGNVIMTYEDRPHNYDAWDVNHYYMEKSWEADDVQSIEVTECGPVRGCVRVKRNYLDSTICQEIYLYADSPRVEIRNVIDWKEDHIFMKALFPVDVHTNEATFDIQFGNVKRPTHSNTSWDMARYEVCMHKWVDLSEDGYGVAMLNDCKYGCSVMDGVIGLSMLKCATDPNPEADKELHEFTFSILPHEGDFRHGEVIREAFALNNPAAAVRKAGGRKEMKLPASASLAAVDQPNVIIESVKMAEDDDAMIVRVYECYNRRTDAVLTLGVPIQEAYLCNLMEENGEAAAFAENQIPFRIRPYEILTFKVLV